MLKKLRKSNNKGFTLIELMIAMAIIGVLAAIAIPNFIAYRDKAYCSAAESDARNVTLAIAEYFSIPSHVELPDLDDLDVRLSGDNTGVIDEYEDGTIVIEITDVSERCPADYMGAAEGWDAGVFTVEMD